MRENISIRSVNRSVKDRTKSEKKRWEEVGVGEGNAQGSELQTK